MQKNLPNKHGIMVALVCALLCTAPTVWAELDQEQLKVQAQYQAKADAEFRAQSQAPVEGSEGYKAAVARAQADVRNAPAFKSGAEANTYFEQQNQARMQAMEKAEAAEHEVRKREAIKNERELWQNMKVTTRKASQNIVADLSPSDPQRKSTEKAQADLEAGLDETITKRTAEIEKDKYEPPKYEVPKVLISNETQKK